MQKRCNHDIGQASDVVGTNSVVDRELIVVGRVDKLDYPEDGQEADHDEQGLASLGKQGFGVPGAHCPGSVPRAHVSLPAVYCRWRTRDSRGLRNKLAGSWVPVEDNRDRPWSEPRPYRAE